jgi:NAD(P)-dependent dehydrogenase (short-subunit alcohol dehydrogenase family)
MADEQRDQERDMILSATGRTVLITGGSEGLGLATAIAYARAGAKVAILARRQQQLDEARGKIAAAGTGEVCAVSCDVTSASDLERAHATVVSTLGGVDVLINNAGKAQAFAFEGVSDEVWQSDIDLKLFAAIRLTRLVWPGMKERRWGRVINVLNTFAKAPLPNTAPTSVTRAAGLALTKVLGSEGAPHNILVNALLVGLIESEQIARFHAASGSPKPYDEFVAGMGEKIPIGRIGRAEEFASAALFLGSEAASYLTGTSINVDGGSCPVV